MAHQIHHAATAQATPRIPKDWQWQTRRDIPAFVLFAAVSVLCAILVARHGSDFSLAILLANLSFYPKAIGFTIAVDAGIMMALARPQSPVQFLWRRYSDPHTLNRMTGRLPAFLVLCAFLPLFAILKPMIPVLNPYGWDAAFIAWDRLLAGGEDPWRLMQPILGYPIVTSAFSFLYHAWFLLVLPFPILMLFSRRADGIRSRFLFAYIATWIVVGFLLAVAFSSVGPCFLEAVSGNGHFAEQMAYLHRADQAYPVLVLDVQRMLLETYIAHGPGHGLGITAMPSMHVALAFLAWLAMRHVSRRAAPFFLAFCVLIFIGSVHLAYHYAVDGIASVAVTAAIWWATGRLIAWWDGPGGDTPLTNSPDLRA